MSTVYLAESEREGRLVCLKVLRQVPDNTDKVATFDRFLQEYEIIAKIRHPNVVQIHDLGISDDHAYIAMEYFPAGDLRTRMKRGFAPAEAVRVLRQMAEALGAIHRVGVLHRDLKPGNVLLQGIDGAGLHPRLPTPRLTDFGLAKLLQDAGEESRSGVPMGSPSYMSPEQASGKHREVGPSADVYGLGAILYEMLTGRPPFRGESPMETISLVLSEEPVPPRLLRPGLPRDLETICLTCLSKDPDRRYRSASALAADLRRWLSGEPISARPASPWEHLRRWARRRPAPAAGLMLLSALALLAVGGLLVRDAMLSSHRRDLERSAQELLSQKLLADRRFDASRLKRADEALDRGEIERAQDILDDLFDRRDGAGPGGFVRDSLEYQAGLHVDSLRGHNRRVIQLSVDPLLGAVASVDKDETMLLHRPDATAEPVELPGAPGVKGATYPRFDPEGRLVAAYETDGSGNDHRRALALWDAADGGLRHRFEPEDASGGPSGFGFSGGGRFAGIWPAPGGTTVLRIWSLADPGAPEPLATVPIPPDAHVCFGESAIAVASPGRLALLDAGDGALIRELPDPPDRPVSLAISADGRTLALCDRSVDFTLRDATTGEVLSRQAVHTPLSTPSVSTAGEVAAVIDKDGAVTVLRRAGGGPIVFRPRKPVKEPIGRFALSPDGTRLALTFWNTTGYLEPTTIRSTADGSLLASHPERARTVSELRFAPDGRSLIIAAGQTLRRWKLDPPAGPPQPTGHLDEAWAVAFSPDGSILASGADTPDEPLTLKLWEVGTGRLIRGWNAHEPATVSALAFSPDGSLLASAGLEKEDNLRLWDPATGTQLAELVGHTDKVRTVAFSPDGSLLASAGSDRTIRIWGVASRGFLGDLTGSADTVRRVAFHPDGRTLASCDNSGEVRLWDLRTGRSRVVFNRSDAYTTLEFTPDGRLLAVADEEGSVTLLDSETWSRSDVLRGDGGKILALAFSPDGRALAVAGVSRTIRVWDPIAGQEVLTLEGHLAQVNGLAFSPDGRTLASSSHDGAVLLWRSAPGGDPAR
jgi:WD40 repeat protein